MKADKWIFFLALWLMCSSSNSECFDERSSENNCEKSQLTATTGSSVFLPCIFSSSGNQNVSWIHNGTKDLVILSSDGRVKFLEPREGRVKVFPVQASERNFSIFIDELINTDLGCYLCKQGERCYQVQLLNGESTPSKDILLLIYICTAVAALILLSVCGYFCGMKYIQHFHKTTQDNVNDPAIVNVSAEGARVRPTAVVHAQPKETRGPVQEHQMGVRNDDLVYENDYPYPVLAETQRNYGGLPGHLPDGSQPGQSTSGIYPNLEELQFERVQSQRTKQRFHIELISRIRQSSLSRHFYVNQDEMRRQQAMAAQGENPRAGKGRKKAKDNCDYKNPIYNRSTDQLNQL